MAHCGNNSAFDVIFSSVAGPTGSISKTYSFLVDDLKVDKKDLFEASAGHFAAAFTFNIAGLLCKTQFNESWISFFKGASNGTVPSDYKTLIARALVFGAMIYVTRVLNDYFQGVASANIKALAYEKYDPESGSEEDKAQAVHHLNKLIDHNTHYVFESVSSLYTFASGLSAVYSLGASAKTVAIFVGASILVNVLLDHLIHHKLHDSKQSYDDANKILQNKISGNTKRTEFDINDFKNKAKASTLWEAIQNNSHYYVENYFSPSMIIMCCLNEMNVNPKIDVSALWDALQNLSSPFTHHLEHVDDTTDDQVYLDSLRKTLKKDTGHGHS